MANRVTIELFGVPRLRAGVGAVTVEAATVGAALAELGRRCPALVGPVLTDESLNFAYILNRNGERFLNDPAAPLDDGDSLLLMALDVGG